MTSQVNGFRGDEYVILSHWDKNLGVNVETPYPKVGGRLRLAHEDNDQLSINTEVIQYNQTVAVAKAVVETKKGKFSGIGMASAERDAKIAPAILELAETRAIARALRFSGYGVEYCGAEEISHLMNGTSRYGDSEPSQEPNSTDQTQSDASSSTGKSHTNGNGNGNGNGSGRITNKQLQFIVTLGKELNLNSKDLDKTAVDAYGVRLAHLTVKDASAFIDELRGRSVPF